MNLAEAKSLKVGQVLYHASKKNADGTPERWRVSGKIKTWKKNPFRVSFPVKRGLYQNDRLTEADLFLLVVNEPPTYTLTDWKYEVANGDTRLGFDEWLLHRHESDT